VAFDPPDHQPELVGQRDRLGAEDQLVQILPMLGADGQAGIDVPVESSPRFLPPGTPKQCELEWCGKNLTY
jgi:hypothetical protein